MHIPDPRPSDVKGQMNSEPNQDKSLHTGTDSLGNRILYKRQTFTLTTSGSPSATAAREKIVQVSAIVQVRFVCAEGMGEQC